MSYSNPIKPIRQWREIGESEWFDCESDSWWDYCNKSPEHDTRVI